MAANNSTNKRVVLSPTQAQSLLRVLDRVLLNVDATEHMLVGVRDRLSDSLSLSRWLRENISLEINALEMIDLAEAVVVGLHEQVWLDADCTALQAIADQLSMAAMPLDNATDHSLQPTYEIKSDARCQR